MIKNELTPNPLSEPSVQEKQDIINTLQTGVKPCDIFSEYNVPLEWIIIIDQKLNELRYVDIEAEELVPVSKEVIIQDILDNNIYPEVLPIEETII
jgi:hypothetical protein